MSGRWARCCMSSSPELGRSDATPSGRQRSRRSTRSLGSLRARRPDVPQMFEDLVLKCLEKSPDHRFQSANELRKAGGSVRRPVHERAAGGSASGLHRGSGADRRADSGADAGEHGSATVGLVTAAVANRRRGEHRNGLQGRWASDATAAETGRRSREERRRAVERGRDPCIRRRSPGAVEPARGSAAACCGTYVVHASPSPSPSPSPPLPAVVAAEPSSGADGRCCVAASF